MSSDGYVYASDDKGACVQNQDPQSNSATGNGRLILSIDSICIMLFRHRQKWIVEVVFKKNYCFKIFFSKTFRKYDHLSKFVLKHLLQAKAELLGNCLRFALFCSIHLRRRR